MAGAQRPQHRATHVTTRHHQRALQTLREDHKATIADLREQVKVATKRAEGAEARAQRAEAATLREKDRVAAYVTALVSYEKLPASFVEIPREENSPLDVALALVAQRIADIRHRTYEPLLDQVRRVAQQESEA